MCGENEAKFEDKWKSVTCRYICPLLKPGEEINQSPFHPGETTFLPPGTKINQSSFRAMSKSSWLRQRMLDLSRAIREGLLEAGNEEAYLEITEWSEELSDLLRTYIDETKHLR